MKGSRHSNRFNPPVGSGESTSLSCASHRNRASGDSSGAPMPYAEREERRRYQREYYQANRERLLARAFQRYRENLERARASRRRHYHKNREAILAAKARRAREHPEHKTATKAVQNALRTGRLTKQPCEAHGDTSQCLGDVEAHHDDYTKPFEVKWLCQQHHCELEGRWINRQ